MTPVLYLLIDSAWIPCTVWYVLGMALNIRGRLSDRKYYAGRAIADGLGAIRILAHALHDGPSMWTAVGILFFGAFCYWDIWMYRRSDDDDDDWGRRLKSWAKSHIPRPTIVQLRPLGSPA